VVGLVRDIVCGGGPWDSCLDYWTYPAKNLWSESLVMSFSRFGNPFEQLPSPLNRVLFERYIDKNFQPLNDCDVQHV